MEILTQIVEIIAASSGWSVGGWMLLIIMIVFATIWSIIKSSWFEEKIKKSLENEAIELNTRQQAQALKEGQSMAIIEAQNKEVAAMNGWVRDVVSVKIDSIHDNIDTVSKTYASIDVLRRELRDIFNHVQTNTQNIQNIHVIILTMNERLLAIEKNLVAILEMKKSMIELSNFKRETKVDG